MGQVFRSRKFTLIELLVVIAIIAIFAAMLMPALSRSKEMARQIRCLSNVKQFITGFVLFAGDHEEQLPTAWYNDDHGWGDPPDLIGWDYLMLPYVGNAAELFRCPSDAQAGSRGEWSASTADDLPASYRINMSNHAGWSQPLRINKVELPSSAILLLDGSEGVDAAMWHHVSRYESDARGQVSTANFANVGVRHPNQRTNYGLLDGSATTMGWRETWQPLGVVDGYTQTLWRQRYNPSLPDR